MRAERKGVRERERMSKRQKEREIGRKSDLHSISHNGTKDEQIGLAVGRGHVTASTTSGVFSCQIEPQRAIGEQSDPGSAVEVNHSKSS